LNSPIFRVSFSKTGCATGTPTLPNRSSTNSISIGSGDVTTRTNEVPRGHHAIPGSRRLNFDVPAAAAGQDFEQASMGEGTRRRMLAHAITAQVRVERYANE
jgi:hypothetical protein